MGNHQAQTQNPLNTNKEIQLLPQEKNKSQKQFLHPITFEEFGNPSQEQKSKQNNIYASSPKGSNSSIIQGGLLPSKSALQRKVQLNMNNLTVINEMSHEVSMNEHLTQLAIPLSVVKLSMDPQLLATIKELNDDFFFKYEFSQQEQENKWKINGKGFYFRKLRDDKIIIVKPGFIYQGTFLEEKDSIVPHGKGTLFTKASMYIGAFSQGEAHGEGVLEDRKNKNTYRGKWVNGEMVRGSMENDYFIYTGEFVRSIANGQGVIQFKNKKCNYKGLFCNGLYEDEKGYFQSEQYDYSGCFREGKKQGLGCLIQKQRYIQVKNKKYKPQQQFSGFFQNDTFKGKKRTLNN